MKNTRTGKVGGSSYWFIALLIGVGLLNAEPAASAMTAQDVALGNQLDRWNIPSRAMAVGGAYAADADGLQGGLTNPASLSRLQTHQFSVEHQRWREGWNLFNTGIALPMYGGHSLALEGTWLDYGELEPESDTELFRPQGNEFKGGLSYSYRFTENSALGFSGGLMSSEIGFRDREYGTYLDFGYLYRLTDEFWLGASVKNVVGDMNIDTGPNKLPRQSRAGFSWSLWQNRVSMTADAVYHEPGEDSPDESDSFGMAGGMRVLVFDHFRFSAGYHNYYDNVNGATGGVQIEYPNFKWKLSFLDTGRENLIRLGGNMRF